MRAPDSQGQRLRPRPLTLKRPAKELAKSGARLALLPLAPVEAYRQGLRLVPL